MKQSLRRIGLVARREFMAAVMNKGFVIGLLLMPAIIALLISGNLELSGEERAALGVGPVIRKPISLEDLTREIRLVIGTPGP